MEDVDRSFSGALLPHYRQLAWLGTARSLITCTTLCLVIWKDFGMGAALELLVKHILFKSRYLAPSNLHLQKQCGSVIL